MTETYPLVGPRTMCEECGEWIDKCNSVENGGDGVGVGIYIRTPRYDTAELYCSTCAWEAYHIQGTIKDDDEIDGIITFVASGTDDDSFDWEYTNAEVDKTITEYFGVRARPIQPEAPAPQPAAPADDDDDDVINVRRITIKGVNYLISLDLTLYDPITHEYKGDYDPEKDVITYDDSDDDDDDDEPADE